VAEAHPDPEGVSSAGQTAADAGTPPRGERPAHDADAPGARRAARGQIAQLTLMHLTGDMYASFLAPLLPIFSGAFNLSLKECGILAAMYAVTANLLQPLWGSLGDRFGRRLFVLGGLLVVVVAMSSLGLAWNFGSLGVILVVAGVGVGAYHPNGAALTGSLSGRRKSVGLSVFALGGNIGVTLSPLVITAVVAWVGLRGGCIIALPGLAVAWCLHRTLVIPRRTRPTLETGHAQITRGRIAILVLLFLLVFFRSVAINGFFQFLPLLCQRRGMDAIWGGRMLAVFVFAGAIGALIGGYFSDVLPRRPLMFWTVTLSTPALIGAMGAEGAAFPGLLALGGFLVFAAMPVNVVIAQELLPRSASAVSGVVMGLAWGTSTLTLPFFGWFGDLIGGLDGISTAMTLTALAALASGAFVVMLPYTGGAKRRGADRH